MYVYHVHAIKNYPKIKKERKEKKKGRVNSRQGFQKPNSDLHHATGMTNPKS